MDALMGRREALERIEEIRALMARSGEYRHLSGWAAIATAALTGGGCFASLALGARFTPVDDPARLAAVWGAVLAVGIVVNVAFTIALAKARGESAWSPAARQMVGGLLPGLLSGAILTVFLFVERRFDALPGTWLVCYGAGLMGASLFAPWELRWAGLSFLLAGGAALFLLLAHSLLAMGALFGGLHVLFGLYVLWRYRA